MPRLVELKTRTRRTPHATRIEDRREADTKPDYVEHEPDECKNRHRPLERRLDLLQQLEALAFVLHGRRCRMIAHMACTSFGSRTITARRSMFCSASASRMERRDCCTTAPACARSVTCRLAGTTVASSRNDCSNHVTPSLKR